MSGREKNSRPEKFSLFDLSNDLQQRNDVASAHPEIYQSLKAKALQLHKDVVAEGPHWQIENYQGGKKKVWNSY